jgi:hypothetical protein
MAGIGLTANNRKLPPLPPPDTLPRDDRRHWAIVFTQARLRKRWTYLTLATFAGVSTYATIKACTRGNCNGTTALKLASALDLMLPTPQHRYTAQEAIHGRHA